MRQALTFIAGLVEIVAPWPYIVDTLKGKTRPNIVTWFTWTLINAINMAAAFDTGAWQTGIYSLGGVLATGVIVVLGLRHGVKKYTKFDVICQAIALLGIPIWLLTKHAELAVLIVLLVDFFGGLPTLRHAWKAPHEETWQTFGYSAVAGILLLASLTDYSLIAVTMPLYIFLFDGAVLATIFYRRNALKAKHA
jgi:hypothetical protein